MRDCGFAINIKRSTKTCSQIGDANVLTIKFVIAVAEMVHGDRSEKGLVSDLAALTTEKYALKWDVV